jgi:hypothetical protein
MTEEDLRAWCWQTNQRCRAAKFAYWIHVSRDKETGVVSTKARNGSDALDVIKVLNGWYPDFINWEQDRLDSEFRILRHVARMGMPESEWKDRFERKLLGAR